MSDFDKATAAVLGTTTHSKVSLIKTKDPNSGVESVFAAHQTVHGAEQEITFIQPSNSPAQNVMDTGGSYTDFQLPYSKNRIAEINLSLSMVSVNPAGMDALPSHFAIDRVEYYSGSNLIASMSNYFYYFKTVLLNSTEQLRVLGRSNNLDADTFQGKKLMPYFTTPLYINLTGPLEGLVTGFLRPQIRIRVFWNTQVEFQGTSPSENNSIWVKNVRLMVESVALLPSEAELTQRSYATDKFTHRFIEDRRIFQQIQSLAENTSYNIPLANLNGPFAGFIVFKTKGNATGLDKTAFVSRFEKIYLTGSNSEILQGGQVLSAEDHRIVSSQSFPSAFFGNDVMQGVIPIVHTSNLFSDLKSGTQNGALILRSQGETLHWSTSVVSPPDGAHDVHVLGLHISAFRIVNGELVSLR